MGMRLHELHPSLVHLPLGLLPSAAGFDLAASLVHSRSFAETGRRLWWAGALGAVVAGLTGLAASQEVRTWEKDARDKLVVHGLGNAAVTAAALGLAVWRSRHRPSVASSLLAFAACGTAAFTAYLGGEIVYARGVGVNPAGGVDDSPALFSRAAPRRLFADAARGLGWTLREGVRALRPGARIDLPHEGRG